jgi:hypothetical protein
MLARLRQKASNSSQQLTGPPNATIHKSQRLHILRNVSKASSVSCKSFADIAQDVGMSPHITASTSPQHPCPQATPPWEPSVLWQC